MTCQCLYYLSKLKTQKYEKRDKNSENKNTRSGPEYPGQGEIGWADLNTNFYQLSPDIPVGEEYIPAGYLYPHGTHERKFTYSFPEASFDFKGINGSNAESAFANADIGDGRNPRRIGPVNEHSLVIFQHSDYDNPTYRNDKVYRLYLRLTGMSEAEAGGSRSSDGTRGNPGREWYLDHISGYKDEYGQTQMSENKQHPERGGHNEPPEENYSFGYEPVSCHPGQFSGMITRGYEKDAERPPAIDYLAQAKKWYDIMDKFESLAEFIKKPTFKGIASEICARYVEQFLSFIGEIIANSKPDDLMNPVASAFSQVSARYIYENCPNHTFKFTRKVFGFNTSLKEIVNSDLPTPGNYCYTVENDEGRHYKLHYEAQVELVTTISEEDFFVIKQKKDGLIWEAPTIEGEPLRTTNIQTNANNQLFQFKQSNGNMFEIYPKGLDISLRSGIKSSVESEDAILYLDDSGIMGTLFYVEKLPSGNYKICIVQGGIGYLGGLNKDLIIYPSNYNLSQEDYELELIPIG